MNVLVSDDSGDLLAAGVEDVVHTLLHGSEYDLCGENKLIPLSQRGFGREQGTDTGGRGQASFFLSDRDILGLRFILSPSGLLDQALDNVEGPCADFNRFTADCVGLG